MVSRHQERRERGPAPARQGVGELGGLSRARWLCGLRNLPRHVVDAKLRAMVAGAAVVRDEIGGCSAAPTAQDQP